jgi:hypothetical protein
MANQSFDEILSGMDIRSNDLKAFNIITEVNTSLAEKALVAATLFDNRGTQILPGYTHHQVIMEEEPDPTMSTAGAVVRGTKSKVTTKRTSGVKPVSFNPAQSALQSARATLLDYYVTPQNRLAITTINDAISEYESKNKDVDLTKDNQYQGLLAIRKGFVNSLQRVQSVYAANAKYSSLDSVLNELATLGVSSTLATVPKAIGELGSNLAYALNNPQDLLVGVYELTTDENNYFGEVLNVLGSIQRDRLTDVSDIVVKTGGAFNDPRKNLSVPTSLGAVNLYGYSRDIAEYTQGAPDRMIGRPVWMGTFHRRFKKLTGQAPNYKLIAENNEAYMNEYKSQLRAATKYADKRSSKQSASASAFTGIEAFKRDNLKYGTLANTFKLANSYMQTFARYEYNTTIRAAQELYSSTVLGKKGDTNPLVSTATLGGSVARYALYTAIADYLGGLADDVYKHFFKDIFGAEDDEADNVKNAKKVEGGLMFDSFDEVPEGLRENELFIVQPGGKFYVEQEDIDVWEKASTDEFWEGMSKGFAQWGFQLLTGKFGGIGTNLINGTIVMGLGDEYKNMLATIGTYDKEVERYNQYLDSPLFSTLSEEALDDPYEIAFNALFPSLSRVSRLAASQLKMQSQINELMEELDEAIENDDKEKAEEIAKQIEIIGEKFYSPEGGRFKLGVLETLRYLVPNPLTNQLRDNISAAIYEEMYQFEEKYDAPKEKIVEDVFPSMTKNQIGIIKGNIDPNDPMAPDRYIQSVIFNGGSTIDNNIQVKTELEIYFNSPEDWQVKFNQDKIPSPSKILNKYGIGGNNPVSVEEFLSYMIDPETNPENYMWWRRVNQAYNP